MFQTIIGLGASLLASKTLAKVQNQNVRVVHAIPGRVRLQCDRWKNEATARNLQTAFEQFPIVKEVKTSEITGSLLLTFQVEHLTQEQFDELVQSAVNVSVASLPEIQSDLLTIMKKLMETVDVSIKRQSGGKLDMDSLLVVVLIINSLMKYSLNPTFATSLLYWSYSILKRKM